MLEPIFYTRAAPLRPVRVSMPGIQTKPVLCALVLLLSAAFLPAVGQESASPLPLFASETPLALTIEGPFRTLSRNRRDREELPGTVRYEDESGSTVTLDVQIRTRGNSRMEYCSFPPLRLNFRRRQTEGTVFTGQNELKLATLCKETSGYPDYLALEHEVYELFNLLTDRSFRVRWVDIEYIDTDDRNRKTKQRPGFLIEHRSELAARNDLQRWRVDSLQLEQLEPEQTALLSVFEFMIGNTDWAGTDGPPGDRCCHNVDVFRDHTGLAVLVPYDFDQSGFVNAGYAEPAAELRIRSVQQRLYRGYCAYNDALDDAFERFRMAREAIESRLAALSVRDRERRRVVRYIQDFYEILDDETAREKAIVAACRR